MMTGVYPAVHGMRVASAAPPLLDPIARQLATTGYETALFSEQEFLVAGIGLESGYEYQVGPRGGGGAITELHGRGTDALRGTDLLYSERALKVLRSVPPLMIPFTMVDYSVQARYKKWICGDEMILRMCDWMRNRRSSRPFHAFVNLMDAHEPYFPSSGGNRSRFLARWYSRTARNFLLLVPELRARVPWQAIEEQYLRDIESTDRKLGLLVRALEETGLLGRSAIIVTADHGQALGEAGTVYHGNGATESVARVPLVSVPPSEVSVPEEVRNWTSLCELPHWMRALARGEPPYDRNGARPSDDSSGFPRDGRVYCEGSPASDFGRRLRRRVPDESWNHRLLAAYEGDTKWVLDQDTGAVDRWNVGAWPDDALPDESFNGSAAREVRTIVFRQYEALQSAGSSADRTTPRIDPRVLARLQSWGYD